MRTNSNIFNEITYKPLHININENLKLPLVDHI